MGKEDVLAGLLMELRRGTIVLSVLSQLDEPKYGYSLVTTDGIRNAGGNEHSLSAAPKAGGAGTFNQRMEYGGKQAPEILLHYPGG